MGIAENIRTLRKKSSLTQKELGEHLNIPFRTIMNWERGIREPSSQNMVLLENFFKVSGAYLRGEVDDPNIETTWNLQETMKTVDDQLFTLLNEIYNKSHSTNSKNRKMTFDILVELRHILNLKDENHKEITLDILQSNIFSLTRFVDIYNSTLRKEEYEIGRLTRAKDIAVSSLSNSLEDMINDLKKID